MSDAKHTISSCRHCVFYEMQGRRGGHCRQLGVSVQGRWKVCSLASPPFASSWHQLERLVALPTFDVQSAANSLSERLLTDSQLSDEGLRPSHVSSHVSSQLPSSLSFSADRLAVDMTTRSTCYDLTNDELA